MNSREDDLSSLLTKDKIQQILEQYPGIDKINRDDFFNELMNTDTKFDDCFQLPYEKNIESAGKGMLQLEGATEELLQSYMSKGFHPTFVG